MESGWLEYIAWRRHNVIIEGILFDHQLHDCKLLWRLPAHAVLWVPSDINRVNSLQQLASYD